MNSGRQFGFAELSTACFIFNFHITKKTSVKANKNQVKVLIAIKEKDYITIIMLNTQTCTQKTIKHKILQKYIVFVVSNLNTTQRANLNYLLFRMWLFNLILLANTLENSGICKKTIN